MYMNHMPFQNSLAHLFIESQVILNFMNIVLEERKRKAQALFLAYVLGESRH